MSAVALRRLSGGVSSLSHLVSKKSSKAGRSRRNNINSCSRLSSTHWASLKGPKMEHEWQAGAHQESLKSQARDFPGGPVAKTLLPMQRALV